MKTNKPMGCSIVHSLFYKYVINSFWKIQFVLCSWINIRQTSEQVKMLYWNLTNSSLVPDTHHWSCKKIMSCMHTMKKILPAFIILLYWQNMQWTEYFETSLLLLKDYLSEYSSKNWQKRSLSWTHFSRQILRFHILFAWIGQWQLKNIFLQTNSLALCFIVNCFYHTYIPFVLFINYPWYDSP